MTNSVKIVGPLEDCCVKTGGCITETSVLTQSIEDNAQPFATMTPKTGTEAFESSRGS